MSSNERVTAFLTQGYHAGDVHTALNLEGRTGIDALQERKKGADWPQNGGLTPGTPLASITDIPIFPAQTISTLAGDITLPEVTMHINFPSPGLATYGFDVKGATVQPNVGTVLTATIVSAGIMAAQSIGVGLFGRGGLRPVPL